MRMKPTYYPQEQSRRDGKMLIHGMELGAFIGFVVWLWVYVIGPR